jgi:pimeloyl-ACP methyl ester carboxylesterase
MVAADPLWGVGCGWAFQSAEWLVESTARSFERDSDLDRAVAGYRKVVRKQLLGHFLMTSEYGRGRRYNPAEKILFAAAPHDDKLARIVQAFGARTIPVSKVISPVTMGRAVMVNLRTRRSSAEIERNRSVARDAIRPPDAEGSGPQTEVRRGSIEVSGITSPFIEAGPSSSAEAVVFVHGNPGSSEDYVDLLAETGKLTRAVAFDMPGFGKADKPADFDYTVEGYATHLGRMLHEVGIERAHLVLHDFGGAWGLAWAAANPEAYLSATLIDTGVLVDYKWHYLAKIWQTPLLGEVFMATTNRPGFRLLLRHGNRGGLPRAFVDRMYEDFDAGTKRAVVELYRATRSPDAAFRELGAALKKLDRPALVIWGRRDPYIDVEQAEHQRLTFPHARVVVLDESGHWPFIDNPGAVRDELMSFLAGAVQSQARLSA